jgi:molybdopterin-guanine dinucleotide biosynthesis protein A
VVDEPADCGPLAGVATALERCETPTAFVAACDMPALEPATVAHLLGVAEQQPDADVVLPADATGGRLHPLHAVYRASAGPKLRAALDAGERSMHRALRACAVVTVPVDDLPAPGSVANLNTAAELAAYREQA